MQTVQEYLTAARILLKDTMAGSYRYDDANLKLALSMAFSEAYRIRPDMFIKKTIPDFTNAAPTDIVLVPPGYQSSFVYYICGWTQLQDEEDTQDARSSVFMNKFVTQLLSTAA